MRIRSRGLVADAVVNRSWRPRHATLELLPLPVLDRVGVVLVGPPQRPLRRQTQHMQQPTDTDHRQRHRELAADQRTHHLGRPPARPPRMTCWSWASAAALMSPQSAGRGLRCSSNLKPVT
jgi:hypothetical protein